MSQTGLGAYAPMDRANCSIEAGVPTGEKERKNCHFSWYRDVRIENIGGR